MSNTGTESKTVTRTVAIGVATYRDAAGMFRTAVAGEQVEVADEYAATFDKFNRPFSIELTEANFGGGIVDVTGPAAPKRAK